MDEIRHDRHWRYAVAAPLCAAMAALGLLLLIGGLHSWIVDGNGAGAFVALVFGLPFAMAFGYAASRFLRRMLAPPVTVRIDLEGVRVGERELRWAEIAAIDTQFAGPNDCVWIRVTPSPGQGRSILVPGPPVPTAEWSRFTEALIAHFEVERLPVRINGTRPCDSVSG